DTHHVPGHVGMERRVAERPEDAEPRSVHGTTEQPLAHGPARLLLRHERQPLGAVVEVDHRIRARPGDARHGEERELAGGEVEGAVERDVERGDVVRQPAQPAHDAAEDARGGGVGLARLQRALLQRAVVAGHALAREQVALALEIFPAGRLWPLALRASAREPRLARPAGAGRALVVGLDPASQPGVERRLSGCALVLARRRPRYLERAVDQCANNYYSELSATHHIATAAANAPFDDLKKCCLFQLADEQRHLEMDREVFERAGFPERDWLPAWESPGTTCRFFRHLLELEDTIEIIVKGNFVAEGAAGPGTFTVLADGAEARGDVLSAVNHRARIRDETRHISYGRALVKALIEDDPANLDTIQAWQDESLRLFAEVARGGERQAWWEGFLASYYKIAVPMGLRPTVF